MTLFPFDLPLRFRYQDVTFLKTLLDATKLLYSPESSVHTKLVQLPVLHMMLTQHSLFLPTMLTSEEEETPDSRVKGDPTLPSQHSGSCYLLVSPASHTLQAGVYMQEVVMT